MPVLYPTFTTLAAELGDTIGRTLQKILELLRNQSVRTSGTALASAARSTTTSSSIIQSGTLRGILCHLNVTAASGTGGVRVGITYIDPVTGAERICPQASTGSTAIGLVHFIVYPGAAVGVASGLTTAANGFIGGILPTSFRLTVIHGDASSYTYSLSYELLP